MSCNIETKMVCGNTNHNMEFVNYLTNCQVDSQSSEPAVLQRLKILAANSNQLVGFKTLGDNTYQVFSSHENIPEHLKLNDVTLNAIVPYRSVVFQVDNSDNITILDYSIHRINNVPNDDFMQMLSANDSYQAYESYEGTIIVARQTHGEWKIRTTSCIDAKNAYVGYQDKTYYDMLTDIVPNIEQKLSKLQAYYDTNVYFVFVLTSDENCHLCNYDQKRLILINVRDCQTQNDLPLIQHADWYQITATTATQDVSSALQLEKNIRFNSQMLELQGYIVKTDDGKLCRTFTNAYRYGLQQIPNYSNMFLSVFNAYLKGTYPAFAALKNHSEEQQQTFMLQSRTVLKSVRNLFAYLYTMCTSLQITYNNLVTQDGAHKQQAVKTFKKKNYDLYNGLFADDKFQSFAKLLAMLQKYSLNDRQFNNSSELAIDVEKFVRSLWRNDNTLKLLFDVIYNYEQFCVRLHDVTTQLKIHKKFSNNLDEEFGKILKEHIVKNTDQSGQVDDNTIAVVTKEIVVEQIDL